MKLKKRKVLIGLTYGDPASIGSEILLKTIKSWKYRFSPVVIGNKAILSKNLKNLKSRITFSGVKDTNRVFVRGKPDKHSGIHSYLCLKQAVSLANNGEIKALITGPVSKKHINLGGYKFFGQTDEMAKFSGINTENVIMLFVGNDLRVALFTRHIPLKDVPKKLNKKKLYDFIVLLNREIKKHFKIKNPKIGILGLNPHASENGTFGDEEEKIIKPVVDKLNTSGLKIYGPLSPDATLAKAGQYYLKNKKQSYDVYVSFYHDQALPMFKAVCGLKGVNVTLGLPFLRVSVDHGTAFDIAGKNIASNEGLISAIKFVVKTLR